MFPYTEPDDWSIKVSAVYSNWQQFSMASSEADSHHQHPDTLTTTGDSGEGTWCSTTELLLYHKESVNFKINDEIKKLTPKKPAFKFRHLF